MNDTNANATGLAGRASQQAPGGQELRMGEGSGAGGGQVGAICGYQGRADAQDGRDDSALCYPQVMDSLNSLAEFGVVL